MSRISLSAYKKNKEALAVAPPSKEKRLGFGESVSTREARARDLKVETQLLDRLEGLLKRSNKDPGGSAEAISNWLCTEGPKGRAKKGFSRVLCYVKVWSQTLRGEGGAPEGQGASDAAESKARAAFGACSCVITAVNSVLYRLAPGSANTTALDPHSEVVKAATEVLPAMLDAMIGSGQKPRSRGLHPTEHARLSAVVASWCERAVLPPSSLHDLEQRLAALKSTADVDKSKAAQLKRDRNKHAAWVVAVPPIPKASDSFPSAEPDSNLPPRGPGSDPIATTGARTEDRRKATMEAALKDLFARNVNTTAGEWWGGAFEGRGAFREGPEGYWSLHLRRAQDDAERRRKQGKGVLGVNGEQPGASWEGVGRSMGRGRTTGAVGKMGMDGFDSDGTPSTPSTVPSEASPSPERASPEPVTAPIFESKEPAAVNPSVAGGQSEVRGSGEAEGPEVEAEVEEVPSEQASLSGEDAKGQNAKSIEPKEEGDRQSPKRALSKREQEAEELQRRKDLARRAGKEKGKVRGLERERQRKDRAMQRQRMIAEARQKREETARTEKEAKEKAEKEKVEEIVQRKKIKQEEMAREVQRERERAERSGSGKGAGKSREAEEDRRRGNRNNRDWDQVPPRERERREHRSAEGKVLVKDTVHAAVSSGGRNKEESHRHQAIGGSRERLGREERVREKEIGVRDREEVRWHNDQDEHREKQRNRGYGDLSHDGAEDRGRDGRRKQGSQWSGEPGHTGDGRRGTISRDRSEVDKNEQRKRRRSDVDLEGGGRYSGGDKHDDRYTESFEHADVDNRPSKKKSKKDRKEKKRKDRQPDTSRQQRNGSEDSRGRKRSRDFSERAPREDEDFRGRADSKNYTSMRAELPHRRSESYRQHLESDAGLAMESERRAASRLSPGVLYHQDSELSPRGAVTGGEDSRGDGLDRRGRRGGGGGDSRERQHSRGLGGLRDPITTVCDGGGLPGMDVYSGASPPTGIEQLRSGFRGSSMGRGGSDRQRGGHGALKNMDSHGGLIVTGREASSESSRKKDGGGREGGGRGREGGGRQRPATMLSGGGYGSLGGLDDDSSRTEVKSERERERERERSDKGYARSGNASGRDSTARRGEQASRQSSSSTLRTSRWSAERVAQPSTREALSRWRSPSPSSYDGREEARPLPSRGGGGGGLGGRLIQHPPSMGMGTLGIGHHGGFLAPVLFPGDAMNNPGGDHRHGRMEDNGGDDLRGRRRDEQRRSGGGGGGGGRRSEDRDQRRGRSEDLRRGGSGGGGGRDGGSYRSRADSRDEDRLAPEHAPPQEEEPEEGELVIEPTPIPIPSSRRSRWGEVGDKAVESGTGARGHNRGDHGESRSGRGMARRSVDRQRPFGVAARDEEGGGKEEEKLEERGEITVGSSLPPRKKSVDEDRTKIGSCDMKSKPAGASGPERRRHSGDIVGGRDHTFSGEEKTERNGQSMSTTADQATPNDSRPLPSKPNIPTHSNSNGANKTGDGQQHAVWLPSRRRSESPAKGASKGKVTPLRTERTASSERELFAEKSCSTSAMSEVKRKEARLLSSQSQDPYLLKGITHVGGKVHVEESQERILEAKVPSKKSATSSTERNSRQADASRGGNDNHNGETTSISDEYQGDNLVKHRARKLKPPAEATPQNSGPQFKATSTGKPSTAVDDATPAHERMKDAVGVGLEFSKGQTGNGRETDAAHFPPREPSSPQEKGVVSNRSAPAPAEMDSAPKRRSTGGDPGGLACFIRKGQRGSPRPGEPTTSATDVGDQSASKPSLPSLPDKTSCSSATVESAVDTSSSAKPLRASVFSRLGAPLDSSTKKDNSSSNSSSSPVAGNSDADRSTGTAPDAAFSRRAAPGRISATWGNGSSVDRTAAASGAGGDASSSLLDLESRKREKDAKDQAGTRVGGGATLLMNTALFSSRESGRRGKRGGGGTGGDSSGGGGDR